MPRFTDDKACVEEIQAGSQSLWEELLDRVTDTVLWVAISWCSPSCARGKCSLLRQQGPLRSRLGSDDCDSVMACYAHIVKKYLPAIVGRYPGEGGLTDWTIRSLRALAGDTYRRIDFARTGHTCSSETHMCIRVPRPRTPDCLQDATPEQREIYRNLCLGKTVEEMASELGLPTGEIEERLETLKLLLADHDWDAYMEMLQRRNYKMCPTVSAFAADPSDDSGEKEPVAREMSVEQRWQLRQVIGAISSWIGNQPVIDQELLRLFVQQGVPAVEVTKMLRDRPGAPQSPRQVYSRVETLVNRMFNAVQELLAHVDTIQSDKKVFVDNLPCLLALIGEAEAATPDLTRETGETYTLSNPLISSR